MIATEIVGDLANGQVTAIEIASSSKPLIKLVKGGES